jgi:hypothetical protein
MGNNQARQMNFLNRSVVEPLGTKTLSNEDGDGAPKRDPALR